MISMTSGEGASRLFADFDRELSPGPPDLARIIELGQPARRHRPGPRASPGYRALSHHRHYQRLPDRHWHLAGHRYCHRRARLDQQRILLDSRGGPPKTIGCQPAKCV